MTTLDEQAIIIAKGRDAKALKENPALQECMDVTMADLFTRWCATGPSDGDARMAIWATAQALGEFKHTIEAFISTGKIEERVRDEQRNNK